MIHQGKRVLCRWKFEEVYTWNYCGSNLYFVKVQMGIVFLYGSLRPLDCCCIIGVHHLWCVLRYQARKKRRWWVMKQKGRGVLQASCNIPHICCHLQIKKQSTNADVCMSSESEGYKEYDMCWREPEATSHFWHISLMSSMMWVHHLPSRNRRNPDVTCGIRILSLSSLTHR